MSSVTPLVTPLKFYAAFKINLILRTWRVLVRANETDMLMIHVICSGGWRQPESIPGRIWNQQVKDAAHPSDQARSRPQLLCLLLRDPQLTRQGLSAGQTGIRPRGLISFFSAILRKRAWWRWWLAVMVHSGVAQILLRLRERFALYRIHLCGLTKKKWMFHRKLSLAAIVSKFVEYFVHRSFWIIIIKTLGPRTFFFS